MVELMKMNHSWVFVIASAIAIAPAWAYTCGTESGASPSTPAERFKDNGNGTLTDIKSGMTWMRCALGQNWNGTTCTGTPAGYNWQAAQDEAVKLDKEGYGGFSDWRVPQIPELAMIVETQCSDPRINLTLFPATPAAYFWSATSGRGARIGAYMLSFGPEGANAGGKEELHYVRLMRSGK